MTEIPAVINAFTLDGHRTARSAAATRITVCPGARVQSVVKS